ncbi:AAA family ATPase [Staphylococcus pseudintermedius]|uniref:AAA family ATPase n=1 Tax=Staphylococcus pseudintermedius TaxID=283734 RepID=UPI002885A7C5|nr:AAA family ATPase [Staphylococcus pseudintermedius]MDT0942168.1 AAA family ATPase [Staphylococcus pseudintermedius]
MKKIFREFEEELTVTKELFYNEGSMYGAYGFKFTGEVNPQVKLHTTYKNFTIVGNTPALIEGNSYKVKFVEGFDERRNVDVYNFVEVKSDGLKDRKSQEEFLYQILTEKQAKDILSTFSNENIIEDIINKKIDLTLVRGVQETIASKIIAKLLNYNEYSKAIVALSPLGAGIKSVIKLSEHFGSPEKVVQIVKNDVYKLTEVSGFGFKTIDKYALKQGVSPKDKRRIVAGALYVIEHIINYGDTKIPIDKFEKDLCDILDIDEVDDKVFEDIINHSAIYYNEGFISLHTYRNEEKQIVSHLRRLRDGFNPSNIDETIVEKLEHEQGFKFNKEQREGIEKAITNGIFVLDGKAGSGKTSLLRAAVESIENNHAACSLSGKAANVLSMNGLNASTIHRLLKFEPKMGSFFHNEFNPLPSSVYILDEASMVNNKLFLDLISAIPTGSPFIIVGDSGQLPAIGHGAVFDYLLGSTEFAHVTLKEVHRQAQDSGTLSAANLVRDGKQIIKYNENGRKVSGVNSDFYENYYRDKSLILNDVLQTAQRYADNPEMRNEDFQVIVGLKEKGDYSVLNLNKHLQEIFNPASSGKEEIKGVKHTFRKGDRIIQQGNNYSAIIMSQANFVLYSNKFIDREEAEHGSVAVFNGTFGTILECVEGVGMLIKFEGIDEPVFYTKNENENEIGVLDLGYAISVHRSQGSGFKTLLVIVTFNEFALLSRQFLYTALTRTIDKCLLFAESGAIVQAIKTDKGKSRKCFMSEFLK